MAKTHCILSLCLLLVCVLLPVQFFKETFGLLRKDILFFVVTLVNVQGGQLLPDLDNFVSKSKNVLGLVGTQATNFCQTTSCIVWRVCHLKGDRYPKTPHRYLWHTGIICQGMICSLYFGVKNSEKTIIQVISEAVQSKQLFDFFLENAGLIFFIMVAFMTAFVGSSVLLDWLKKLFRLYGIVRYVIPVLNIAYILTIPLTQVRLIGLFIGFGYTFHIIEDIFADTGVPLLFPLPLHKKMWWRLKFPVTVKTGGSANKMVDIIAVVVFIVLVLAIFFR